MEGNSDITAPEGLALLGECALMFNYAVLTHAHHAKKLLGGGQKFVFILLAVYFHFIHLSITKLLQLSPFYLKEQQLYCFITKKHILLSSNFQPYHRDQK